MNAYTLTHVPDSELIRGLTALVARDRATTALLLAHIAEVEKRRLYAPAGCASMLDYCERELRLPRATALKRLRAARRARQYPRIFEAIAEGRLHLGAVVLLSRYLEPHNADELLQAAENRTCDEIERMLAERFPVSESIPWVQALPCAGHEPSAGSLGRSNSAVATGANGEFAHVLDRQADSACHAIQASALDGVAGSESSDLHGQDLRRKPTLMPPPRNLLKPQSFQRFALQVTIDQSTHDRLEYARSLLRHQVPSGDLGEILHRALVALVSELEKKKFAATSRRSRAASSVVASTAATPGRKTTRYIPAAVRRAVHERDGGRCTYVSADGRRCGTRDWLEFDHVVAFARGGEGTVENLRLRCRAHNQLAAEQWFGRELMTRKRGSRANLH